MSINNFEQVINLKVKITTLLDQTITGYIYAFSSSNEVLSLRITSNETKKDTNKGDTYRIINTSFIKSMQVLPPFPNKKGGSNLAKYSTNNLTLHPIDVAKLDETIQQRIIDYKPSPVEPNVSPPPQQQPAQRRQASTSPRTQSHNSSPQPIAHRLYDKFVKLYGKDKVKYSHNQHDIILFEEIKISKPFTLSKSNFHKFKQDSTHVDSVQRALKQFWLEVDNEKRGG
ncbi:uncharacterized protein SPAPADRAFT_63648 [Spathaspora passalidarum NRRL Y-27907]|uniref:LSM12 anticodon-binding domain-containing protein n=1 Tax=Spathaspora passalidarum (strain NRRL Y-27907 / 11-Y1) TaxID=619300 RepID=G3AUT7_SPAPN|nr:uncharacterized protein SPAPADRAFT_63648 [Spathaspora passalidarum NRRL Y-27907]EGW30029.1 hypothetical protein SPAPADRAFT_63648 [Spathaspora passalidarum NRRL Y-27907]